MTYQILIFSLWRLAADWMVHGALIFASHDLYFLNSELRNPSDHVLHLGLWNLVTYDLDNPVFNSDLPWWTWYFH
jgi:hypothetical protein